MTNMMMDDLPRVVSALGLPMGTVLRLTDLKLEAWGQNLYFAGEAANHAFDVRIIDCRELQWQMYTHMSAVEGVAFPVTEWVNFRKGKGQHYKPAHFLTAHFGLKVLYGQFDLIYDGETVEF